MKKEEVSKRMLGRAVLFVFPCISYQGGHIYCVEHLDSGLQTSPFFQHTLKTSPKKPTKNLLQCKDSNLLESCKIFGVARETF